MIDSRSPVNSLSHPLIKKTLAIFSLTSCEGCQFELLGFYDHFQKITDYYNIENFRLGQEINLPGPFDVAIIEGNPDSDDQISFLKQIRKHAKTIIAIGACAHMGGIQSQRNQFPKKFINKSQTKSVPDIIKVDYVVPGCPISHREIYRCLMDVYWDKKFDLPDLAVCFECRQNQNECLIKKGKPCLGPITRAGCDSICINNGEACLGCRGPIDQANFPKMREILGTILEEDEIKNWLTIYGDYEQIYKKEKDDQERKN